MRAGDRREAPVPGAEPALGAVDEPVKLAFFLVPQFSLMAFSSAIEPLRAANRLSGRSRYEWQLASLDGQPVAASNGVPIGVHAPLDTLEQPDMLLVCAGLEPLQLAGNRRLHHRLRRFARHGCRVGAISGGSFILADAGLLSNRLCTVHWEYNDLFAARYPDLKQTQDLYVVDRDVFTCSGGIAALDMMLHFVREQCGSELALAVAEQFLHPRIREQGDDQRMELHARYGVHDPKLVEVIRLMESTIDAPLYVQAIAARVGVSPRQVERLFRQQIGEPPGPFYLRLRLERGRTLLMQTSHSIQEVALACGFGSTSHFAHAYKRHFRHTPTDERRRLARRG
jgi:transcriptional regulator GlxA family with amidase domain